MKYQPPSLQLLLCASEAFKVKYLGKNNERLSFIWLYSRLTRFTQQTESILRRTILSSAAIFELVTIEKQYNFLSPKRSTLYQLLITYLNITPINPLSLDDRLIHLVNFFHFVQNNLDSDMVANLHWKTKAQLLDEIKNAILAILNKQVEDIKNLLAESPVASALEKNIGSLLSDYKKILDARWFPNDERRALLNFFEAINNSCQVYTPFTQENLIPLQADLIRQVRLGLVLFALIKINGEYRIFSSCRSQFFKNGLKTINLKNLDQLSTETKISWLRALSMYIKSLKERDKQFDEWQTFETEIDNFLAMQEILVNKPSRARQCLNTVISCGARYGITFALTQFATKAAIPSLETALVGTISGPVGVVIYSAAGTIIANQLIDLLNEKIIPAALASLYTRLLTKIGDVIGETSTGMIALTFNATTEGLGNLLRFYSSIQTEEELKKDEDWILALLNLPDDIFPKEKKDLIKNIQDISYEKIESIGLLLK